MAYFDATEYDLLPGPEAYPELQNSGCLYLHKRATASITGGALRLMASGLGNGSLGRVGLWECDGSTQYRGLGGVQAEGDVDWEVGNLLRWE